MSEKNSTGCPHRPFPPGAGIRFAAVYATLFLPFAVATPYLQTLLRLRGYSSQQIGVIQGTLEVMAILAPPVWGYIGDRLHRPRLVLALAVAGVAPMFLCFGAVRGLATALGVAVLFGLFYRPVIPLTDGLTFRYLQQHGGDYGRVRCAGSLSFIVWIAALEALGVSHSAGGHLIAAAMLVACVANLFALRWLPAETPAPLRRVPAGRPDLSVFLRRRFVMFTLAAFLGRAAMMGYYGFFTLFLREEIGFEQAGYIWIIGPLSEFPVIYFSRRIMGRIGERNLFALGLFGCATRLTGFGVATSVWHIVPLQLLHSLTFGAFHTASVTFVSKQTPAHLHGTAQTLFAAFTMGAGGIVGGVVCGYLAETYGFACMYRAAGLTALTAMILLLLGVRAEIT